MGNDMTLCHDNLSMLVASVLLMLVMTAGDLDADGNVAELRQVDTSVTERDILQAYAASDGAGTILLQRVAPIEADAPVRLLDVARLSGDGAEALGELVLETETSKARSVTLQAVRGRLDALEVDWSRLSLRGYQQCSIDRAEAEPLDEPGVEVTVDEMPAEEEAEPVITPGTIKAHIEQLIRQSCAFPTEQLVLTFQRRDAELLGLESDSLRVETELRSLEMPGRLPVIVRIFRDGVLDQRELVYVDVTRELEALVTNRTIARGDVITARDIETKQVRLTNQGGEPLTTAEDVVGKTATAMLRPNTTLTARLVATPLAVKRGDRVVVEARAGSMLLRTSGRAMEDGVLGEVIRVRSERFREEHQVMVVAYGKVRTLAVASSTEERKD